MSLWTWPEPPMAVRMSARTMAPAFADLIGRHGLDGVVTVWMSVGPIPATAADEAVGQLIWVCRMARSCQVQSVR